MQLQGGKPIGLWLYFIEGFGKIHNNQVCLYVFVIAGI
jgi:hypothetical protein